jgi:hypothetical protein
MKILNPIIFKSFIALCIILASNAQISGQTWSPNPTNGDTDWHNASNWSTGVVPGSGDNVIIPLSAIYPVITAPASVRSIDITNADASLTINSTLLITNSTTVGLYCTGTVNVNVNGVITIDNSILNGIELRTGGVLVNSGTININNSVNNGLLISGLLNNLGTINIDNSDNSGICVNANSSLDNSGIINVNDTVNDGILLRQSAILNNSTTINIGINGSAMNIGRDGLRSFGIFNNLTSGLIYISETNSAGIANLLSPSVFTNNGIIEVSRNNREGIFSNGTLTNNGTIDINDSNLHGFVNTTTLTNNGTINIDRITFNAYINTGVTNNNGSLSIGLNLPSAIGLDNSGGTFSNNNLGSIYIDRVVTGIRSSSNGIITNDGNISIATNFAVVNSAMVLNGTSSFTNNNLVTIGGGAIGQDGISMINNSSFSNTACAVLELFDNINNTSTNPNAFTNDGYIELNTPESHFPGIFNNNGLVNDEQGTLAINGMGFNNTNIIIAPVTITCDFTVIENPFAISGNSPYMVDGIFTDASATMTAGTYDQVSNRFTPTTPLLPNSSITYYVKFSDTNGICSDIIVAWMVDADIEIITFDGGGDGTDWHDPLNWDQDIVPTECHHVIIPSLFTVVVKNNNNIALGRTLDVRAFAEFETLPGGLLDIKN